MYKSSYTAIPALEHARAERDQWRDLALLATRILIEIMHRRASLAFREENPWVLAEIERSLRALRAQQ